MVFLVNLSYLIRVSGQHIWQPTSTSKHSKFVKTPVSRPWWAALHHHEKQSRPLCTKRTASGNKLWSLALLAVVPLHKNQENINSEISLQLSNWCPIYTHTDRAGQCWLLLSLCFWSVKLSPDARGTRRCELVFVEQRIPVHTWISQPCVHCIKRLFKTVSKNIKIKTLMSLGASLTGSAKMLPKRESLNKKSLESKLLLQEYLCYSQERTTAGVKHTKNCFLWKISSQSTSKYKEILRHL